MQSHGQSVALLPRSAIAGPSGSPPSAIIDLKSVAHVLYRRKWIVVATILVCLMAILAYRVMTPSVFEATTRILIDPHGLQVVDRDLKPQNTTGTADFAYVESQMRVMTSDHVLGQVVDEFSLSTDPEFGERPPTFMSRLKALASQSAGKPVDRDLKALRALRSAVDIERTQNSYVVDLSVETWDAARSAEIANAIARSYVEFEFGSRSELARGVSASLENRLSELRAEVKDAEEKVERFTRDNDIVQFARGSDSTFTRSGSSAGRSGGSLSEQQVAQISDELQRARALTAQAQARHEQIEDLKGRNILTDSVPESVQSDTISALRERHAAARQIEASLGQTLGDRHPRLIEARAQVGAVRRLIGEELGRIAESASSDFQRAKQNEDNLQARLNQLQSTNADVNDKLVRLRELQRNAEASRLVFETFLVRAREVDEQKSINTSVARVLSPAVPPDRRSGAPMSILLALALVFGSSMGGALAYAREQFDPTVLSPDQLADATGLQVLASLPGRMGRATRFLGWSQPPFAAGGAGVSGSRPAPPETIALARIIEHVRLNASGRSVLLTAQSSACGKSAIALNLALAAAASGDRVLLIDADFMQQTLSALCDDAGIAGIVDLEVEQFVLSRMVADDPHRHISFLRLNAGHLGTARKFVPEAICLALQSDAYFDTIVIDAPVLGPDRWLGSLAAKADETVVVAREGHTHAMHLGDGVSVLRGMSVSPLGAIFLRR